MGLFDNLIKQATTALKQEVSKKTSSLVTDAKNKAVKAMNTKTKAYTFDTIPTTVEELKALPEAQNMKDYMGVTALTMLVLMNYTENKENTVAMLDYLMGPGAPSNLDISRLNEYLGKAKYIPASYFEGATVENNYVPKQPFKINVIEGVHSKDTLSEGYIKMFVHSAGADADRYITLRTKPSTGEWFITDYVGVLSGIRVPAAENPWA